jgi:hypothetical protein
MVREEYDPSHWGGSVYSWTRPPSRDRHVGINIFDEFG